MKQFMIEQAKPQDAAVLQSVDKPQFCVKQNWGLF